MGDAGPDTENEATTVQERTRDQLLGELLGRGKEWAAVYGIAPDAMVERLRSAANLLTASLYGADDEVLARAALEVLELLYPGTYPEWATPGWWRTPLGRRVAAAVSRDDRASVTRNAAATMLGVRPGTAARLLERGALERHPDGGISRASVLARIAQQPRLHRTIVDGGSVIMMSAELRCPEKTPVELRYPNGQVLRCITAGDLNAAYRAQLTAYLAADPTRTAIAQVDTSAIPETLP